MTINSDAGMVPAAVDRRRLGRLAASDAELNIKLLSRLAEASITSGDIQTAVEAVRACTAEAEQIYRLAIAERDAAVEARREAAAERAHAETLREAAAVERARAVALHEAADAQQARAHIIQAETANRLASAKAMRDEAMSLRSEAQSLMAGVDAQRRVERRRAMSVPRRMRVSDANGLDLRPDPTGVTTADEYIAALRDFRTWAGNPSYRDMSKRCNGRPVASTIYKVLESGELPKRFEVIEAIISSCGGIEEDRARFATAWRLLVLPERKARSPLRVISSTSA